MQAVRFCMNTIISTLDDQFRRTHERSAGLLSIVSDEDLFRRPRELDRMYSIFSVGENVIRSAAVVEQVIGGITTRLWDDPFEWTLTEELCSSAKILDYIDSVESARVTGFRYFTSDGDLARSIPAPERLRTIFSLLSESVAAANHYQGRAYAILQVFSDAKPPAL